MSEVRYRTCDHCGEKLDEAKDYIEVELDKYGVVVADLCESCYDQLEDLIKKWVSQGRAT